MSMQENIPEAQVVKVLHAGSLTTLVRQELAPALYRGSGIALESEPGHSVALAMAVKEGRTSGDVYLSADAEVNRILRASCEMAQVRTWLPAHHQALLLPDCDNWQAMERGEV